MRFIELRRLAESLDCQAVSEDDKVMLADSRSLVHATIPNGEFGVYELSTWMGSGFPKSLMIAALDFAYTDPEYRMED